MVAEYFSIFLVFPILSFVFQIFIGHRIGRQGHWFSLLAIGSLLALSLGNLQSMLSYGSEDLISGTFRWIDLGAFILDMGYKLDNLTAIMLVVVSLVSFLVHLYSIEYMKGDERYNRYFGYLGLFTFSMNGIVLADNLIMMYIFWELVGLSSYLLIGHWFEKDSAANACKKAFLTNRVGDIGMFLGIMTIFFMTADLGNATVHLDGMVNVISTHFESFSEFDITLLTIAGILIFLGAVGKSAQFPLHIWLPDAMEGPTPVSALIHAATMVAAGVFMVVRIFPILTPQALEIIAVVGAVTALMAAIVAITQRDIKRVLAYSTVSQLGYMIMALGVGAYQAAFFHLSTHAMFKACLFLCSGSVIHGMHHALHKLNDHDTDPQDMFNMGGLWKKMPLTWGTMVISTLAISGVPLFSGFLSKDAILAGTLSYWQHHQGWTIIFPIAGFGAAVITAFYMFRLIFLTFHNEPRNNEVYKNIHESPYAMTMPLLLLALLSFAVVFTGGLNPIDSHGWFTNAVSEGVNVAGLNMHEVNEGIHHAHDSAMFISLLVAGLGILTAFLFYFYNKINVEKLTHRLNFFGLFDLSFNKFYIDELYDFLLYQPFLKFCKFFSWIDWDFYDQKIVDFWGWFTIKLSEGAGYSDYNWLDQKIVDGFGHITNKFGKTLKVTQTGIIQNYLLGGVVGIVAVFIVFKSF